MDITGFALVTGAGSGIGRACAISFASEGAAGVAALDVNASNLESVSAEVKQASTKENFQCLSPTVNVRDENNVVSAFSQVASHFGRLDYVANSACITYK